MLALFESLRKLQSVMMRSLLPALHELDLSKSEIMIIMCIHHKKMSRMTDFAKMADVPASSFTGIIDRLVKRNFVVRENDPADRRSVLLRGTQELTAIAQKIHAICNEKFNEVLEQVPEELIKQTAQDLDRICEYLSEK